MDKIEDEWIKEFRTYIDQFQILTDEDWNEFLKCLSVTHIKKKSHYITPLDQEVKLGFIIKGILRTYFLSANGVEYTTDFCRENELCVNNRINNPDLSSDDSYSQALEECIILSFTYRDILNLGKKSERWALLKSRILEYYFPIKIQREKNLLSLNAEERYLFFRNKYEKIINKIPQYQIASYLGITHIALSRLIKKLNKKS